MASSGNPSNDEYYNSKWGRVVVFKSNNYALFRNTCTVALVASGSWEIVQGTEAEPAGARLLEDWKKRRNHAIQIISSSVSMNHHMKLLPFITTSNPKGMWDELKKSDRANDVVHMANLRTDFGREQFDPSKQTIQEFVARLDHYRVQLYSTNRPITDEETLDKLLQSLPVGDALWQQAKNWCLRDKLNLEQAIIQLQSNERSLPPSATAAAATTNENKRGDSRGRRGRGRGKRGFNNSSRSQSESSSRSSSRVEKAGRDQCRFCLKKGHYQADCIAYKKAQKEVLDKRASNDKEKEKKLETGNVAGHIVDDEYDSGTIYIAAPVEYAMSSSASAE